MVSVEKGDQTPLIVLAPVMAAVVAVSHDPDNARMALLTVGAMFGPLVLARRWARIVVNRRASALSEFAWLAVPAAAVSWAMFAWSVAGYFPDAVHLGINAGAWASLAIGGLLTVPGPWTPAGRLLMRLLGHNQDVSPAAWIGHVLGRMTQGLVLAAPLAALGFGLRRGLAACALAVVAARARSFAITIDRQPATGRTGRPSAERHGP